MVHQVDRVRLGHVLWAPYLKLLPHFLSTCRPAAVAPRLRSSSAVPEQQQVIAWAGWFRGSGGGERGAAASGACADARAEHHCEWIESRWQLQRGSAAKHTLQICVHVIDLPPIALLPPQRLRVVRVSAAQAQAAAAATEAKEEYYEVGRARQPVPVHTSTCASISVAVLPSADLASCGVQQELWASPPAVPALPPGR